MKNILRLIFKLKPSPSTIKIVMVFFLISFFFFSKSYAANTSWDNTEVMADILYFIVGIANRAWILFANLAGKFMTNSFVYGSVLWLDKYLYVLWNIVKNFANYLLWFLFLFHIFKTIFKPDGATDITKKIPKMLMVWVLIQASWFLFAVVIDVSTIAVAGLGSFPSQFLASNQEFSRELLFKDFSELWKYTVKVDNNTKQGSDWREESTTELDTWWINRIIDAIMPDESSLAGPFMYLWLSVFKFQENSQIELKDSKNLSSILIDLRINGLIILVYTLILFALFLTNLFRILALRIAIPLSPFMALFALEEANAIKWKIWSDLIKQMLDIKNILKLLFKPVVFTVYLSLIFIIAITMKWVLTSNRETIEVWNWGVVIENTSDSSTISSDGIFSFSMEWTKNGVSDIIVYMLLLFLLFSLAKLSIESKTGIGFIDDSMKSLSNLGDSFINNVGIIPIWKDEDWNVVRGWIWAMKHAMNVLPNKIERLDDENVRVMKERYWLEEKDLWRLAMSGWKDRRNASQEKLSKQDDKWSLVSGERASYLPKWINNNYEKYWAREKTVNEDLFMYFSDSKNELLLKNIIYELTKNWNMSLYEWNINRGSSFSSAESINISWRSIKKYKIK